MPSQIHKIPGTKVTSPFPVQLTPAETRLIHTLEHYFAPENIFADYYLPKPSRFQPDSYRFTRDQLASDTELTQIDCLAISEQGIFVFESKDYSGWIYGRGHDRYWTETLNFGQEKHRFYNPVKQNQLHLDALRASLATSQKPQPFPNPPFFSIIVFGSNAILKNISCLPNDCHVCTHYNLRSYLSPFLNSTPESTPKLSELRSLLTYCRINPTQLTRQTHIAETSH